MSSKTFTVEELANCTTADRSYVAIRGKVYDVSKFIERHPGGRDMLYLNCGKDATQLFEAYHPDSAALLLPQFEIGTMVKEAKTEYPEFPPMSEFYKTAKQRVAKYFESRHMKRTDALPMLARALVWAVLSFAVWYLGVYALLAARSLPLALLCAAAVGFFGAMISLMPVHEASHGASTSSPWVWRVTGAMHDWINGASYYAWLHQHLLGHHPFTHIEELDPDIVTGDPDARRIKKSQQFLFPYRFQHIYMPLLYGLLAPKFRIHDVMMMFSKNPKNGAIRANKPDPWHWFNFVAGKIFFFTWRFLLTGYLVGYWNAFLMCAVADLVISYYLALVFQPSHVVSEAEMIRLGDKNRVDMDWAEMQVRTTIDYGHNSALTTFLTGGLNYQVAHHLFPGICQLHYPAITPIILETCKEFNIPYVTVPTYWDALLCHFRFLYQMGQQGRKVHTH